LHNLKFLMNQQGRAFSTASIIFTAGVGSTSGFVIVGATEKQWAVSQRQAASRGRPLLKGD
jgi:hypothetical protein